MFRILLAILICSTACAQDSALAVLQAWKDTASNAVRILPVKTGGQPAPFTRTNDLLGTIAQKTGGIIIDSGWIRILGAGAKDLRSITDWNLSRTYLAGDTPTVLLIADDVLGGLFALNGGSLGPDQGAVYYFDPQTLEWESLSLTYSEFIHFCFNGDLQKFYERYRWPNWQQDVGSIPHNNVVFEGGPPQDLQRANARLTRLSASIAEYYELTKQLRKRRKNKADMF